MPYSSGVITTKDRESLDSLPKYHFGVLSNTANVLSLDADNPSFFLGFGLVPSSEGFELNSVDGSIKNISGRSFTAVGTISFQPTKAVGTAVTLQLWSERSLDNGVTWVINDNTLRSIDIANDSQTFKTALSVVLAWENNALIRFRLYILGSTAVTLAAASTVSDGVTITGPSVVWELSEL